MVRSALIVLAASLAVTVPAHAQKRGDQDQAYEAARSGEIKPLGPIISKVGRRVGGDFVGSDYDSGSQTYRLKYLRDGSMVVVDVDARTGAILGMQGN